MGSNRLTKKQKAEQKEKAIESLQGYLPIGSKLYMMVTKVAKSGMSREIVCMVAVSNDFDGKPGLYNVSHLVAQALGWRQSDRGVRVEGCGMDMGFHLAHELSYVLHGWTAQGEAAGYTIKHSWV